MADLFGIFVGGKSHFSCNQEGCNETAAFLFTWPGKDMAGICEGHAPKLRAVIEAMGLHLQLIPCATLTEPEGGTS